MTVVGRGVAGERGKEDQVSDDFDRIFEKSDLAHVSKEEAEQR